MRLNKQYWWEALELNLFGKEGEEGGTGGNEGDDGQGGNEGDDRGGSGNDDQKDDNQGTKEDVSGLKSALEKERTERKDLEKQLKAFQKAQKEKEDAEKTEVERLGEKTAKDEEKIGKLAAKFRVNAVDAAIKAAAEKFIDPSDVADALRNNPDIVVEQDEDDPSDVKVDAKSVRKLVDDLAKRKTHWLKGQGPSGSKFGGTGNSADDEKALLAKYPALASRMNAG